MPRDDPQATPWSVPNPRPPYSMISRLVGSTVLWMNGGGPVTAVTADGTTSQVLDFVQGDNTSALPGPDGSLLMVGKLDHEYAVHRFTEGADGSLQRAEVLDIPWHPSRTTSLALSQGRLATADTYFGGAAAYHEQKLALSGTPSVLTRENLGSADAGECDAAGCPLLYPTGDGRVLHQGVDSGGKAELRLIDKSKTAPGTRITTGLTGLSVESVSGRYVAYRTASATEVRDIDSRAVVRKTSAAPGALWGATLWQSAGAGKVTATDVRTGTVNRTLSLGTTSCTPSSVQATARYLYVECGSASARVVKLSDGSVRSLSTGSAPGLLGDGFVVRVGADRQVALTDLTPATPATRVLGTARGTAAGRDWTVDPYGGHVAYVDTGGDVHVVPTGITTGVLGVTDSSVATSARVALDVPSWRPTWWISKPVASWQLTLKNKVSGKTVRTLTGGEARGQIATTWDGWTGVTGIGVPDATYTWTLTARPADGQGAALIKSGSVKISGARPAHHDFVGFGGIGDLLTLNSSGAFTFQHGTGKGTFSGKTSASGWPTSAIAVPFGVLGGGDHNVVLVRLSSGELRSYRPNGGALRPSTPYTSLGKGWNAYNALTSPGDLTGDGRPDLVARKASTGDIYLFAGTSTGKLAAGKRINTAWTAYTRIIGVGDLNGDGIGEVLARHKDGTLYRYDGRGNGTLKSRVTVFTKWGASYNAIVGVGDITGDGKPDLVARDTAGNLYRNNGKGNGSFSGRVKIATGWKGYKGIF
ncbi:FG-GAP repeat domain-containing protein [Streptomyces sp. NPDC001020]